MIVGEGGRRKIGRKSKNLLVPKRKKGGTQDVRATVVYSGREKREKGERGTEGRRTPPPKKEERGQ